MANVSFFAVDKHIHEYYCTNRAVNSSWRLQLKAFKLDARFVYNIPTSDVDLTRKSTRFCLTV